MTQTFAENRAEMGNSCCGTPIYDKPLINGDLYGKNDGFDS